MDDLPTLSLARPGSGLESAWPLVRKLVQDACDRGLPYTPQDVLWRLRDAKWRLFLAHSQARGVEAICIIEIVDYPKGRTLEIPICTGSDRARWLKHFETIREQAKSDGCVRVAALTRPGWAKILPGGKVTHVLWECQL